MALFEYIFLCVFRIDMPFQLAFGVPDADLLSKTGRLFSG
jgi:hypothetical protein